MNVSVSAKHRPKLHIESRSDSMTPKNRRFFWSFGTTLALFTWSFAVLRSKIAAHDGKEKFHVESLWNSTSHHSLKEKRLRLWFTRIRSGNARWRNKEFAVNQVNIAHWKFARVCLPCARGGAERSEAEGMLGTKKFLIKLGSWRFLCYIKHNDFCIFKYSIKNVTKS